MNPLFDDVLVPHDLTDLSDAAFGAVAALGRPRRLHVVHVLRRLDPALPGLVWSRDEDPARTEHARAALRSRLHGSPLGEATVHVRVGDPGSRIVELAREIGAGLVIVPSHSRVGLERLLLGSVAEHVARFAPCPVLVLPAAAIHPVGGRPGPADLVPEAAMSADEAIDRLGSEVCDRVARTDRFLAGLRIGIAPGEDAAWWESAVERRLADAGIAFVDLTFTHRPGPSGEILDARFEDRFA